MWNEWLECGFEIYRFEFCVLILARVEPPTGCEQWFMNLGRTVFAQLLDELPSYEFRKCVARYDGDHK
jgi:hypothetical protein